MPISLAPLIDRLLEDHGISPVLVDIGASGGAPEVWAPLARHARYVGFDPDLREIRRDTVAGYRSGVIINKAVSADAGAEAVTFYLTENPYCSSMLRPDAKALSNHSFWRLFEVKREVQVPSTTLERVLADEKINGIDWLKIDAQGADLRIYRSLGDSKRGRLLALDTEPGLIDAYEGEDLFVDVHRQMRLDGFWLSNLNVMGVARYSAAVSDALDAGRYRLLDRVRTSPGWCEARYFRTVEYLVDVRADENAFILAWTFALVDRQHGHALDLAARLSERNPRLGTELREAACALLAAEPIVRMGVAARIRRRLRRVFS